MSADMASTAWWIALLAIAAAVVVMLVVVVVGLVQTAWRTRRPGPDAVAGERLEESARRLSWARAGLDEALRRPYMPAHAAGPDTPAGHRVPALDVGTGEIHPADLAQLWAEQDREVAR